MGRPKKSELTCIYCDKTFKRRFILENHMLCHKNELNVQSRRPRVRSNWCHVCRQSFSSEREYKRHILTEHQYDSYEMDSDNSNYGNEDVREESESEEVEQESENEEVEQEYENEKMELEYQNEEMGLEYENEMEQEDENEDFEECEYLSVSCEDNDEDFYESGSEYVLPNKNIKPQMKKAASMHVTKSPRKKVFKEKISEYRRKHNPSLKKIKTEPLEMSSGMSHNKNLHRKKINSGAITQFIQCSKCSMQCKGQRGLKIHLSTTHRRNSSNSHTYKKPFNANASKSCSNTPISKSSSNAQTRDNTRFEQELPEQARQSDNSVKIPGNQSLFTTNGASNLGPTQTGVMFNMPPVGNEHGNNIIRFGNQPNIQYLPIIVNPDEEVETIPKFDFDNENYIKWLKKFIYKCKVHRYPLTRMLCQSVSHINEEITDALANPVGSMTKRSTHFYFIRIQSVLSDIMMGHMRHSLNVVRR